jgi:hypothetical protein
MKNTIFLTLLALFLFSFKGYSQSYEVIYMNSNDEIQSKIDQNKVAGIEILTGIWSHQTIGLSGLSSAQKEELTSILSKNKEIQTIKINVENNLVNIVSTPKITKEVLKDVLDQFNIIITGYTVNYELFIDKN